MQTCTLRDLVAEGAAAATETDPDAAGSSAAHNEARDQVWEQLLTILTDKHDGDVPTALLRRSLLQDEELLAVNAT